MLKLYLADRCCRVARKLGVLALMLICSVSAHAEDRFAVIVYAEDYGDGLSSLKGASEDAVALTQAFRQAGYEVRVYPNATAGDIRQAGFWLTENLDAMRGEALGVYYFIGHGAQVDGRAYLFGVDAKFESELELTASTVSADAVTAKVGASAGASLVAIDAITLNEAARGLRLAAGIGPIEPPENGTLILSGPSDRAAMRRKDVVSPFAAAMAKMVQSNRDARSAIATMRSDVRKSTNGLTPAVYQRPVDSMSFRASDGSADGDSPATLERAALQRSILIGSDRSVTVNQAGPQFGVDLGGRLILAEARWRPNDPPEAPIVRLIERNANTNTTTTGPTPHPRGPLLVLVPSHGHNVASSAELTAQLAYKLNLDGEAAVFSWPSLRERSPVAYQRDTLLADRSGKVFAEFIDYLSSSGFGPIWVIADGLGARVALGGLETLGSTQSDAETANPPMPPPIAHIILTVPDTTEDRLRSQLAQGRTAADLTSIYVAPADPTLILVAEWSNDPAPVGLTSFGPNPDQGVHVIIAPPNEGAGATLFRPDVLADIAEALFAGASPAARGLKPAEGSVENASGLLGGSGIWALPANAADAP